MRDALGRVQSLFVLGGDSDIGSAVALQLARKGLQDVLLAGRNTERLDARAATLRAAGVPHVETTHFDADDTESHEEFLARSFKQSGGFDVVLLAFGVLGEQRPGPLEPDAAVAVARTNYLGAASVLVHCGELLRRQGQGCIVVLSSVAAQRPRRSNFIYGASKAGIDALAEGLSFVLRDEGVQVLVVRPGFVRSKMTSHLRASLFATTPAALAADIVNAIASGKELIWTPGRLRYVMWILRLIPRSVFRRLTI